MTDSTENLKEIVLRNERLMVTFAAPGSAYRGTRFDWTAFITQVRLDAVPFGVPDREPSPGHTFCVMESFVPGHGTGGIGLCNEFGIEMPVGYADAQPGETFPKIGIGLLIRPDDEPADAPYCFFRPYAIAQRFPVHVEMEADRVKYIVEPLDCRGYAVRLVKTVSLDANTMSIHYDLENVGRNSIVTREYVHNFVGIDGHALGPDYILRMPYPVVIEPPEQGGFSQSGGLEIEGYALRCRSVPAREFYVRFQGFSQTSEPQWALTHVPSGITMTERVDFAPARVAVWGKLHVISPEIFVDVDVRPGETQHWTRQYTFDSAEVPEDF